LPGLADDLIHLDAREILAVSDGPPVLLLPLELEDDGFSPRP